MKRPNAVLIAGIAEGFGLALAETFACAGANVIGLARTGRVAIQAAGRVESFGRQYRHIEADLRDPAALERVLVPYVTELDTAIVLAQRFQRGPFLATSAEDFADVFATNCAGAANLARLLLPPMLEHEQEQGKNRGTLIFAGATASLRGGAQFSALAASKFALRGLAQSLAREFGPRGIHVAHLVIDAPIDTPQTAVRFPAGPGPRIDPVSLAQTCLMLSRQPPDCFTHELDLRPAGERF
jgi:NAD(P)-dependent dehydrogenase (short-subunit alcohol dehydrogenase family)